MHSAAEAFARFLVWRQAGTPLRVAGGPECALEYLVWVVAASAPLLAICDSESGERMRLDLSHARFFVGRTSVAAVREGEEPLLFEELAS